MKISGPASAGASALRRTEKRKSGGGTFETPNAAVDAGGPAPTSGANPIAAVDTLLSIQEVADPNQGDRDAAQRGKDVLDLLDEIRFGLLNGRIPEHRLTALVRLLGERHDTFVDPRLSQIVDEIELRARVELAKLGH